MGVMPSSPVVFRFPSGESEWRYPKEPPQAGDKVRFAGETWVVVSAREEGDRIVAELRRIEGHRLF
jgi:hypothetical protein